MKVNWLRPAVLFAVEIRVRSSETERFGPWRNNRIEYTKKQAQQVVDCFKEEPTAYDARIVEYRRVR